jgi:hypothetical protein
MSFEMVLSLGRLEHAIEKPNNKPTKTMEGASGKSFRIRLPPGSFVQWSAQQSHRQTAIPHVLFLLFIDLLEDWNMETLRPVSAHVKCTRRFIGT